MSSEKDYFSRELERLDRNLSVMVVLSAIVLIILASLTVCRIVNYVSNGDEKVVHTLISEKVSNENSEYKTDFVFNSKTSKTVEDLNVKTLSDVDKGVLKIFKTFLVEEGPVFIAQDFSKNGVTKALVSDKTMVGHEKALLMFR